MSRDAEQAEHVADLLADWAPVRWRRMFGGIGLFRDAAMFGLIFDGEIYFRVAREAIAPDDPDTFTYQRGGRAVRLGYRRLDAEALEEAETLQARAAAAFAAVPSRTRSRNPANRQPRGAST